MSKDAKYYNDKRISIKFPKERGEEVFSKVKEAIIRERGCLHGYFSDTILNLLELALDFADKYPAAIKAAHTHDSVMHKKRNELIKIANFVDKHEEYFTQKARLFDDLYTKVSLWFGITDKRAINPKITEICKHMRVGILKLHDGHEVILAIDSRAYELLEVYNKKYKGKRDEPRSQDQIIAYKSIMRDIFPQKKESFSDSSKKTLAEQEADDILRGYE